MKINSSHSNEKYIYKRRKEGTANLSQSFNANQLDSSAEENNISWPDEKRQGPLEADQAGRRLIVGREGGIWGGGGSLFLYRDRPIRISWANWRRRSWARCRSWCQRTVVHLTHGGR